VEPSNVKRRLTCILAADAVGYSQQTSIDEEATLRVLAAHRAVIDGIIAFHDGRIVSTAGDSVLAEFASPVEAVRCAVEIQEALKTRNDSLSADRRLQFRVGVNLGDVVVKNEDLLGDGVNVAARLESIADPGGVCISSSVYDQITGKLNLGFQDIGEQSLKNISRPIRAYRLAGTGAPLRPVLAPARRPTHRALWAIGILLLAAGLGIATWQLGWLGTDSLRRPAAAAIPAATPANAVVSAPAPDSADKLKAATEAATATMRIQMEEEAQRARRDAEAMRRATDAELARARAEADASRAARLKAEAEMMTERARMEADATTTRAKSEAAAMTRAAEADLARAAQARKDAEAAGPTALAAASAVAKPTAAAASSAGSPPAGGASAYDGTWVVTRSCERTLDLDAFSDQFVTNIRGGEVAIERGKRDQPGYMTLHGRVADDGGLALTGHNVSRSKRNFGKEVQAGMSGSLAGKPAVLNGGWGGRNCTFTFSRAAG
jgi:class 3 adenylate cyclase